MKTVKLNNGTILEVGKKYSCDYWGSSRFIEIISLTDKHFIYLNEYGNEFATSFKGLDLYPYTSPQEEVKWKTFLMVVQHHKSHIPYQVIIRCKSIEDAKIIHKNAISITEVEIDIREK